MFKKKLISRCPDCRSKINPQKRAGLTSICGACGWAGSFHSHRANDRIQMKVSAILLAIGLLASYALLTMPNVQENIDDETLTAGTEVSFPQRVAKR